MKTVIFLVLFSVFKAHAAEITLGEKSASFDVADKLALIGNSTLVEFDAGEAFSFQADSIEIIDNLTLLKGNVAVETSVAKFTAKTVYIAQENRTIFILLAD